jgi:hypothetical protein
VPHTVRLNDIASFDFPGFNLAAYEQQLADEFGQLYAEGATRRRMMVIGPARTHIRVPCTQHRTGYRRPGCGC